MSPDKDNSHSGILLNNAIGSDRQVGKEGPAGQGTGLGLSICYDIIKTAGGEIKVETEPGEFAEFIISVPIT